MVTKLDKVLCCRFLFLFWPWVVYWPRNQPTETFWLRNSRESKTKDCARSWTFQHKSRHLCLLLWRLPGFITIPLALLTMVEPEVQVFYPGHAFSFTYSQTFQTYFFCVPCESKIMGFNCTFFYRNKSDTDSSNRVPTFKFTTTCIFP